MVACSNSIDDVCIVVLLIWTLSASLLADIKLDGRCSVHIFVLDVVHVRGDTVFPKLTKKRLVYADRETTILWLHFQPKSLFFTY